GAWLAGRRRGLVVAAQGRATLPATRSVWCRVSPTSAADAAAGPEPERYADPAWWSMHLCQRLVLPLIGSGPRVGLRLLETLLPLHPTTGHDRSGPAQHHGQHHPGAQPEQVTGRIHPATADRAAESVDRVGHRQEGMDHLEEFRQRGHRI